jgi:hypothetical protein
VHPSIAPVVSTHLVSSQRNGGRTSLANSASSVNRGLPRRLPFLVCEADGGGEVDVDDMESLKSIILSVDDIIDDSVVRKGI